MNPPDLLPEQVILPSPEVSVEPIAQSLVNNLEAPEAPQSVEPIQKITQTTELSAVPLVNEVAPLKDFTTNTQHDQLNPFEIASSLRRTVESAPLHKSEESLTRYAQSLQKRFQVEDDSVAHN